MRADRLISILLRLHAYNGITAKQLADELAVSTRTIYRDIEALSMAGIPVYAQRGEYGGLFLDEDYKVSLTNLMLPEIQALFVMGGSAPLEALNLDRRVEDSLLKLFATLPSRYQMEAKALQQRLYIDTQNWNQPQEDLPFLDLIQMAVWQDRIIEAVYQAHGDEAQSRKIIPYGLVVKAHIWYLVGLKAQDMDIRIYRVSRFQEVKLTDALFQRDPDFDLKAIWHEKNTAFEILIKANYITRFRLAPHLLEGLGYFIEDRYQIIEKGDDDVLVEARFYNIHEARSVLMGFGNQLRIIEPQSLRESVLAVAQSIVEQYQGDE